MSERSRADGDRTGRPVTHTSRQRKDADREGFTGGGPLHGREEFTGRPNVTEERQDRAIPADEEVDERLREEERSS